MRSVPTALQRKSGFTDFSDLITLRAERVGADVLGRTFPPRHCVRSRNDARSARRVRSIPAPA